MDYTHHSSPITMNPSPNAATERTVSFTVPPEIPLPKFVWGDRVSFTDTYDRKITTVTGNIIGLDYLDAVVADVQGFGGSAVGWYYKVRLDESLPLFDIMPVMNLHEDSLNLAETPEHLQAAA